MMAIVLKSNEDIGDLFKYNRSERSTCVCYVQLGPRPEGEETTTEDP